MKRRVKKSWCETCIGCQRKQLGYKDRFYYCKEYVPVARRLNYVDGIIKEWMEERGRFYE